MTPRPVNTLKNTVRLLRLLSFSVTCCFFVRLSFLQNSEKRDIFFDRRFYVLYLLDNYKNIVPRVIFVRFFCNSVYFNHISISGEEEIALNIKFLETALLTFTSYNSKRFEKLSRSATPNYLLSSMVCHYFLMRNA